MAKGRGSQTKQSTPPPEPDLQDQGQAGFIRLLFGRRQRPHRRSLLGRLLLTRLGRLVLLVTSVGTLTLVLVYQEAIADAYRATRDTLLEEAGVAWGGALLWAVAALVTLRVRPRLLARFWYRWLGGLALVVPLAAFLAQFNVELGEPEADTLGGDLGSLIAGPSLWTAIPVILAGIVAAAWIAAPRRGTRIARQGLRRSGRAITRGAKTAVQTYRRVRPDRYLARGVAGLVGWGDIAAQSVVRAWRVRRAQPSMSQAAVTFGQQSPSRIQLEDEAEAEPSGTEPEAADAVEKPVADLPEPWWSPLTTGEEEQVAATASAREWELPSPQLLQETSEAVVNEAENQERALLIERALSEYGIEVQVKQIRPGPTVTMFGLAPGWVRRQRKVRDQDEQGRPTVRQGEEKTRVRVDAILAREKDLALALAAPSIRIEAPVPGESVVGIEVPNQTPSLVTLRAVMESEAFEKVAHRSPLAIALGKGAGGEAMVADLARMPHLLIAGSTGSGKSVCINSIISCLLLQAAPTQLRMLMVDPKRVELTPFNGIPHLLVPVIVDTDRVVHYLRGVLREMDRRYRTLEEAEVRNIEGFNAAVPPQRRMPYLLIAIDELADLMMSAPHDVEHTICRLAQLGRATGIHLVIATQRPSVDVVTGLIKANFPSRISFNVTSQVDSRTILDSVGAEKLLGRGDMLFLPPDAPKPRRVQGAFVSDEEIARLVQFWSGQHGPPLPGISLEEPTTENGAHEGEDERDELFQRAVQMASTHRHLSTSLLQRRLRIGYPRAARLREQLEEAGVIAPNGEVLGVG